MFKQDIILNMVIINTSKLILMLQNVMSIMYVMYIIIVNINSHSLELSSPIFVCIYEGTTPKSSDILTILMQK